MAVLRQAIGRCAKSCSIWSSESPATTSSTSGWPTSEVEGASHPVWTLPSGWIEAKKGQREPPGRRYDPR